MLFLWDILKYLIFLLEAHICEMYIDVCTPKLSMQQCFGREEGYPETPPRDDKCAMIVTPTVNSNLQSAALALCQSRPLLLEGPPGECICWQRSEAKWEVFRLQRSSMWSYHNGCSQLNVTQADAFVLVFCDPITSCLTCREWEVQFDPRACKIDRKCGHGTCAY